MSDTLVLEKGTRVSDQVILADLQMAGKDAALHIRIGPTPAGCVVIDYGVPIKWVALTPEEALEYAETVRASAQAALAARLEVGA